MNESMLIGAHKSWKKGEPAEISKRQEARSAYRRVGHDLELGITPPRVNFAASQAKDLAELSLTTEEEIYWSITAHDSYIKCAELYEGVGDKKHKLRVLARAAEAAESLFAITVDHSWASAAIDEKTAEAELYLEFGEKEKAAMSFVVAANIANRAATKADRQGMVPFREKVCELNSRSGQQFLEVGNIRRAASSYHIMRETAYNLREFTGDQKYTPWIVEGDRFFASLPHRG